MVRKFDFKFFLGLPHRPILALKICGGGVFVTQNDLHKHQNVNLAELNDT